MRPPRRTWSCLICICFVAACREHPDPPKPPTGRAATNKEVDDAQPDAVAPDAVAPAVSGPMFVDVTTSVGLDFRYQAHPPGDYHLPSIMGGGAAVFDADDDGRLDIYFLNGNDGTPESALTNRLFLQQPDGTFVDATEASGLGDRGYGMGCAVGDIDNDGDDDLYVTNYGEDRLYRNEGDGTFVDFSEPGGIANPEWGASAAFFDFDRDGWLDIYVTNYVTFDHARACEDDAGRRDYCGPGIFPGVPDRLFRNQGDGTFVDVTHSSGIGSAAYAGLGVVCADFNDDGWIDAYVANDMDPNLLWLNQGDGTFVDDAIILGAAYNAHGQTEAGMGVCAGDADEDGDLDLFVTHFKGEKNTFYRSTTGSAFIDATSEAQLGMVSIPYVGWGAAFFDADLDSDLDLAVANGAVVRRSPVLRDDMGFWSPYAEPNHLFLNDGQARFESVKDQAGAFTIDIEISRGLIPADIDSDGDLDLLVTNVEGPARLYRNETNGTEWISVHVVDPAQKRTAVGAKVVIHTESRSFVRHATPPAGYLTAGPPAIHLGLPRGDAITGIDVRWPDGAREHFGPQRKGRIELRRGGGAISQ